jgi:putative flavoprotein involved in K+ transport
MTHGDLAMNELQNRWVSSILSASAELVIRTQDGLVIRYGLALEDGRVIDVANIVWCTGFAPDVSWIDLPVVEQGAVEPTHERGIVDQEPGLYFVGLFFLYAASSALLLGVGRDAEHVVESIQSRTAKPMDSRFA